MLHTHNTTPLTVDALLHVVAQRDAEEPHPTIDVHQKPRPALEQRPPVTDAAAYAGMREAVTAVWDRVMVAGEDPPPL